MILDTIGSVAEILVDLPIVDLSPDPKDNMIIATAIKGQVDHLVSGDKKDLLSLVTVQSIPIISARNAVTYLGLVDS